MSLRDESLVRNHINLRLVILLILGGDTLGTKDSGRMVAEPLCGLFRVLILHVLGAVDAGGVCAMVTCVGELGRLARRETITMKTSTAGTVLTARGGLVCGRGRIRRRLLGLSRTAIA